MKIAFLSARGDHLALAKRLEDEGADVVTYVHNGSERYNGMLKSRITAAQLWELIQGCGESELMLVQDGLADTEWNDADRALLGPIKGRVEKATCALSQLSSHVSKPVLAGSWHGAVLQQDREQGRRLALNMGLKVPRYQRVSSIADALSFLKAHRNDRFVLKVDGGPVWVEQFAGELFYMLSNGWLGKQRGAITIEDYLEGASFIEEAWWDGEKVIFLLRSLELPGCGLSWIEHRSKALIPWDGMARYLKSRRTYRGPIRAETRLLHSGELRFTGWKLGLTDTVFPLLSMLRSPLADLVTKLEGAFDDEAFTGLIEVHTLNESGIPMPVTGEVSGQLYLVNVEQGVKSLQTTDDSTKLAITTHCDGVDEGARHIFERAAEKVSRARICGAVAVKVDTGAMSDALAIARKAGIVS